jgi:3',5'-cyclic AMP phosphodiesterase CpdA
MALRLIQLSDIHFGFENQAAVEAAASFVRQATFDLLVISGDITQLGAEVEFAAAAAWLAGLPGAKLATPGNHDTPWAGLVERVLMPWERYERWIGPHAAGALNTPALTARSMNSARGWQIRLNWSKGEIARAQAQRAAADVQAAPPGARRIVTVHHPLMEFPGEPMTARVRGGRRAAERLALAGVDLILSGHIHTPFVQALPFGDRRTFAVGAGTLSRRERGEPAGFNVIDIDGEALTVAAMAWGGHDFQIGHAWEVTLRPPSARPGPGDLT